MLVEQKRIKGEKIDDIANRSNENLNNMAQFFLWKDEKEFMSVYKRSMEILLYKNPSEIPPSAEELKGSPSGNVVSGSVDKNFMKRKMIYVTGRGYPQTPGASIDTFFEKCLNKDAKKSWENIDNNTKVLNVSSYDKVAKNTTKFRFVFTADNASSEEVFVTRIFMDGVELFGKEKDYVGVPIIMNCK